MERGEGLSEEGNPYFDVREMQMARNAERMKILRIPAISSDLKALPRTALVEKPRKKVM
jgi:hypothetical protein